MRRACGQGIACTGQRAADALHADSGIKGVGLDKEALAEEIAAGTFDTIIGEVQLETNHLCDLWWVGQWQDGVVRAIGPADKEGVV